MASEVDIANTALAHLGEEPAITALTPPSGGAHAKKAKIFYPLARNAALELHDWHFATARAVLALLDLDNTSDGGELPDGWGYGYSLPSDYVKAQRVQSDETTDDSAGEDFVIETLDDGSKVLFTNVENAVLVYTKLVTDTTKYSGLFVVTLGHMLASMLAGPVLKGREGRLVGAEHLKQAMFWISQARTADANAGRHDDYTNREPASIAARR